MHAATDTLVTLASIELATHGATRFTKFLTPFVTEILQARCRQEGFPPGTANHAEIVYNRMATHATASFDPESGRNVWVNTISRNRLRDLCNGTSKDTIDRALHLLAVTGIIRPVDPGILTDMARKHHALAFEVDHDGLAATHDSLRTRGDVRRWEPAPQVTASAVRESVPVAMAVAGNGSREPGNGCRHPDSQTPRNQKDHHDSHADIDGDTPSIPVDAADAAGLAALLGQHPELQDQQVTERDIPVLGRIFDGTAAGGEPLTLSALASPLRRHRWTWRAMANLMAELKASRRLTHPAGWFRKQLEFDPAQSRYDRALVQPAPAPVATAPRPADPPARAEITDAQRDMARQRMAEQRPDLDPEQLAREILATNTLIQARGWDAPLSRMYLSSAIYEVCRQVTASHDLPAFQAMESRIAGCVGGI